MCVWLLLTCLHLITRHISGGSSESDLPDSDSLFGINSGANFDAEIDSDSGVDSGADSEIRIDSRIGIESTWESLFAR